MICPHCKQSNCVNYLVHMNAETYGNNIYIVDCIKCMKKIRVIASRQVVITSITKASEREDYSF